MLFRSRETVPAWVSSWHGSPARALLRAGRDASLEAAVDALRDEDVRTVLFFADSLMEHDSLPLPLPSGLVLGGNEPWLAEDIAAIDGNTDVVILCTDGGANGAFEPGEGPMSLASALLRAGTRAVCASIFPVSASSGLISNLLAEHALGQDLPQALRAAQLRLIADGAHPIHWAGWRVLTSLTPATASLEKPSRRPR